MRPSALPALAICAVLVACSDDNRPSPDGGADANGISFPDVQPGGGDGSTDDGGGGDAAGGDGPPTDGSAPLPPGCDPKCFALSKQFCPSQGAGCAECTTDDHCLQNPFSLGSRCSDTHHCTCQEDADCVANQRGPRCGASRRCGCESDADCPLPERCLPEGYLRACRLPCQSDADCPSPSRPACDATTGKCLECVTSAHCTDHPDGGACMNSRCGCAEDSHCASEHRTGNTCVKDLGRCGCTSPEHCQGIAQGSVCNARRKCTCNEDSDCEVAPNTRCSQHSGSLRHLCLPACSGLSDCPPHTVCNTSTGRCVDCLTASDCLPGRAFCDSGSHSCVSCLSDTHCAGDEFGEHCLDHDCSCTDASDCPTTSAGGACQTSTSGNRCGCTADVHCVGNIYGQDCDIGNKHCGCKQDADCPDPAFPHCTPISPSIGLKRCSAPCQADADCSGGTRCDSSGRCRACLGDEDCTLASRPHCDVASDICVECVQDSHCSEHPDGASCLAGSCGCSSAQDCVGYHGGPTCSSSSKRCSCAKDEECAANSRGSHCAAGYSKCACLSDAECQAPYPKCTPDPITPSLQRCFASCASDSDCPPSLRCNTASGRCSRCLHDTDCMYSHQPYCDLQQGTCAECLLDAHCSGDDEGSRCLNGRCGCELASDCSGDGWGSACVDLGFDDLRCGCTDAAHCTGNPLGPHCHVSYRKCGCLTDADCTDGTRTRCIPDSVFGGARYCAEPCTIDAACPKGMTCHVASGRCVFCLSNNDCDSSWYPVCGSLGYCVSS